MKKLLVSGISILGLAVSAGIPRITVEQEIMKLEEDFAEAEVKADIHRMSELLADDWTDIEDNGSMHTKADALKLFQSPTTKLTSDKLSEMHVRVYGDTAVITLLDTADFIVDGKDAGGVFRLTDVWVKRDGKWQMVALHSSKVR
jgi:ketosteroid isomerase-like protein